jgi:hypothetical protein
MSANELPKPTLDILVGALSAIDDKVNELGTSVQASSEITDQVLGEISLQIAFLMQTIRVTKPLHGGIADANGQVQTVTKSAAQIYIETGREKMLAMRGELQRAQGLPPNAPAPGPDADAGPEAPAGNGEAKDAIVEHVGPKPITH